MASELLIRSVNIALLGYSSLVAIAMMTSFRKDMLSNRSQRLFFSKIGVATVCMICHMVFCIRGMELRDPLNVVLLSLSHVGVYIVFYLYIEYLRAQIEELDPAHPVHRAILYFSLVVCVVGSTLWVISTVDKDFERISGSTLKLGVSFRIGQIGGLILIAITLAILIKYYRTIGKRHTLILSAMPVLMLIATFADPYAYGVDLYYPLIVIEFCIIYTQHHLDVAKKAERDEVADTRAKLALATGRMKPHYLYNVLTTIYYLCESDPQKAQRAIGTFSEYLRSTLETMEKQELVNFSWELGEIRHYLELEKLRFGKRLTIEYDIEAEDFLVPPLSIQPLVENAVKHGIAPREEGGTVRIVSRWLSDGGAQIRIIDDGVGFDVKQLRNMDVTHEGLANVRERIRLEVGGELTITSSPGKKTTAIVTIRPPANQNGNK